jgi:hypothetical protein
MVDSGRINNHAAFIWGVADLLRGDYKQSEYDKGAHNPHEARRAVEMCGK